MQQLAETQMHEVAPESVDIPGTQLRVSRVALGTWAMGGWMWGGTDERESVATIRAALEQGINLIDTAPVYGFGVSEEIVGQAVGGGRSALTGSHCHQSGPGMARRKGLPERDPGSDHAGDRRLAAPTAHRLHRHLPGPLARPARAHRGDRRGDAHALRSGEDSRHRRQQFLGGTDGALPPGCASARAAATLQSLRARHRSADSPLLPARTTSRRSGMARSVAGC